MSSNLQERKVKKIAIKKEGLLKDWMKFISRIIALLYIIVSCIIGFFKEDLLFLKVTILIMLLVSVWAFINYWREKFKPTTEVKKNYGKMLLVLCELMYFSWLYFFLFGIPGGGYGAYHGGIYENQPIQGLKEQSYNLFRWNFQFIELLGTKIWYVLARFIIIPWGLELKNYITFNTLTYLWCLGVVIIYFYGLGNWSIMIFLKFLRLEPNDIKKFKTYFNSIHSRTLAFLWSFSMYVLLKVYKFGITDNLKHIIRGFVQYIDIKLFTTQGEVITEALLTFIIADVILQIYAFSRNQNSRNEEMDLMFVGIMKIYDKHKDLFKLVYIILILLFIGFTLNLDFKYTYPF